MRTTATTLSSRAGSIVIFLLATMMILVCQPLLAQETGVIKGRVFDKGSGDPLPFANIIIVGTTIGAATDISGNFTLLSVPAGTKSIRVGYVGYVTRDA